MAGLCACCLGSVLTFQVVSGCLPALVARWGTGGTQAGIVLGSYFAGYLLAALLVVPLTDRVGVRPIYLGASCWAAASSVAAVFVIDDWLGVAALRAMAGAGLAGTYVPGMRAIAERLPGRHGFAIGLYVCTFGVGVGISHWSSEWVGSAFSLEAAFAASALGPALAAFLGGWVLPRKVRAVAPPRPLLRLRLGVGDSRALVWAYSAHTWELYGMRAWLPTFLFVAYASSGASEARALEASVEVSTLAFVVGGVATAGGGWLAERIGCLPVAGLALGGSGVCSILLGFSIGVPNALLPAIAALYGGLVSLDSAALSSGVAGSASPDLIGATLASQTALGFLAAAISPVLFGCILDVAGGVQHRGAWTAAFVALGIPAAFAGAALLRRHASKSSQRPDAHLRPSTGVRP